MDHAQAFWARVDMSGGPDGCWPWTGRIHRNGYGVRGAGRGAHRYAYEQAVGHIPAGMTIDHLCFTTVCVNPKHLRLLDRPTNSRNQRSASRTHCVNGHEYTPDNTYVRPRQPHGSRDCRACIRARVHKVPTASGGVTTETLPRTAPAEPTTPIKPSEAIRLGCLLAPEQAFGLYVSDNGHRACAIGAASLGYGERAGDTHARYAFGNLGGSCPVSGCPMTGRVMHLNDYHSWSREAIADWLERLGL